MQIPSEMFDAIRGLNVDEHRTQCFYKYWEDEFPDETYLAAHLACIRESLGSDFTRSEIVDFYRRSEIKMETKFLAAMIWGHEAPADSRRDPRGPWKLSKMFADPATAQAAIRSVSVETPKEITLAYKLLDKTLDRCGPNFFTKHFYFLGKAKVLTPYPLIFDDRVANGLVKLAMSSQSSLDLVRVSAVRKPEAYLQYLNFAEREAKRIGCEMDQIEYFLFNL